MPIDPSSLRPPIVWRPDPLTRAESNLGRLMDELGLDSYAELHRWSVEDRGRFWGRAIERLGVVFRRRPAAILDGTGGPLRPRWLPGARINCVDSCLKAPGDRTAIVAGREGGPGRTVVTYRELGRRVARVAHGLTAAGIGRGEGVALYMPMTVDCVAAYLGIVAAGCRVVCVADSFPPSELRRRLQIGEPRLVITVDRFTWSGKSIALYDTVREAGAPRTVVIAERGDDPGLRSGDLLWSSFLGDAEELEPLEGDPDEVTNLLFSSGTTGQPKAVPWTHLTAIKCAVDGHFHQDIRPGDVVAWPTNVGWMMGPWLIYAALFNEATLALYEGAPTGRGFSAFVGDAGVTMLGVVPSLVRAWRRSGALDHADWSGIRVFSSTGEPSDPGDYGWLMGRAGNHAPVIEYCGGTEIGGGYLTGTVVQPASPATFTTPALGLDLVLLDEDGRPVAEGEPGEAWLVPPSIGLSHTLLNADHDAIYYDGAPAGPAGEALRRHGDRMLRLPGGFYRAQGRADDSSRATSAETSPRSR